MTGVQTCALPISSVRYSLADTRVIDALDTMRAVLLGGLSQQARLAQGLG